MNNLKIHKNQCKEDVLNNIQVAKDHTEYAIGKTLFGASNIGNRNIQEDSFIIMEHPIIENLKLIAVADGLGGRQDGEKISNYVIKWIINWFENIDIQKINDISKLKTELMYMRYDIKSNLDFSFIAATTLSLALIGKNKTLIANIGDSRIYTLENSHLQKETRDDSEVQNLLEDKQIISEELIRFHKRSNYLTNAISSSLGHMITYKIIDNTYDQIIAVTDGVTSSLSAKQLENILINNKSDNIAKQIVDTALITNSYLKDIISELGEEKQKITQEDYISEIKGGIDNTTAAVYIRK